MILNKKILKINILYDHIYLSNYIWVSENGGGGGAVYKNGCNS